MATIDCFDVGYADYVQDWTGTVIGLDVQEFETVQDLKDLLLLELNSECREEDFDWEAAESAIAEIESIDDLNKTAEKRMKDSHLWGDSPPKFWFRITE